MPTYINTSSGTIKIGDTSIPPGETITLDYYVKHDSLTLTLHTPRVYPIKTIKSGTINATDIYLVDLDYPKVCVLNESGEDTEVWFNDYSLHKFKLFGNSYQVFDNERKNIGSIHVSGEGVANIRVTNMY